MTPYFVIHMTLEEMTILRRDELLTFFKARYGSRWRQVVTNQVGLHPRSFQYWKYAKATSLYGQLIKLERWARTVGFQSALDETFQDRQGAHAAFKNDAAKAVSEAESKRKQAPLDDEGLAWLEIKRRMEESFRQSRAGE